MNNPLTMNNAMTMGELESLGSRAQGQRLGRLGEVGG